VVSWAILTSVFLQLRGSSTELRELRRRAEELQSKVIRGAPRPPGFDTEVDERQRIVLARPKDWQPRGGTIFELEEKVDLEEKADLEDIFPASFKCYFLPIKDGPKANEGGAKAPEEGLKARREKYYEQELNVLNQSPQFVFSSSYEIMRMGAEASEIECLKVIAHQCAQITIGPSPNTGRMEINWRVLTRDEFTGRIYSVKPEVLHTGGVQRLTLGGVAFREGMVAYVNGMARETRIMGLGWAEVLLQPVDVYQPRALEIQVENRDTRGLRSNTYPISVVEKPEGEPSPMAILGGESAALENPPGVTPVEKRNAAGAGKPAPKERTFYEQITRMRVVCYHEALGKIFYFEFFDDVRDFKDSSAVFNRILASTRFLD